MCSGTPIPENALPNPECAPAPPHKLLWGITVLTPSLQLSLPLILGCFFSCSPLASPNMLAQFSACAASSFPLASGMQAIPRALPFSVFASPPTHGSGGDSGHEVMVVVVVMMVVSHDGDDDGHGDNGELVMKRWWWW